MSIIGKNNPDPQAAPAPAPNPERRMQQNVNLTPAEILSLLYSKWYWFLLSLVVCLAIAFLYLARTQEIFQANASILIINDPQSTSGLDLSDLGIRKPRTNINNEIYTFSSPTLMTDVVAKLGLNSRYFTTDGLRFRELYKESPVIVIPADTIASEHYRFNIRIDDNGEGFVLSNFNNNPNSPRLRGKLGQTVRTPIGAFTILGAPGYRSNPLRKKEIIHTHAPVADTGAAFSSKVHASTSENKSTTIALTVSDISFERARDILDNLIEAYDNKHKNDEVKSAIASSEFIRKRLDILEEDLGDVESNISSFKASTLIPDVGQASSLYFGQTFQNQSNMLNLSSEISMAQMVRRELVSAGLDATIPANTGIASPAIASQITEYNNLVLQRNRLLTQSSENNPILAEITSTINTLKTNMVRSLDNYIKTLQSQLGNITTTQHRATSELSSNPNREKYLLSIERQQKVKEQLYLFLLQKREESELSQAYVRSNITVLQPASGSRAPVAPRRASIILIAIVIGLGAPLLIFFLREMFTSTVQGRKDIANMSLPFVGEIPMATGKKARFGIFKTPKAATRNDVVVHEGSNNIINEAFRAIRTSLDFMNTNPGSGQVISFTSARTGSGKTFVVMNLATALSINGKKVCVIDLDLRKATLSKWGQHTDRGISNYLVGNLGADKIILHNVSEEGSVDLVPVGVIPPNPVELLSHPRLKDLIEELRQRYDYVLIDCPPAEIVTDARIISQYVDMTIFIIRVGMFEKEMIQEVEEWAATGRYKNLAIILNGALPNSVYHRRRYGYGYGYGYSYSRDHKGYYGERRSKK